MPLCKNELYSILFTYCSPRLYNAEDKPGAFTSFFFYFIKRAPSTMLPNASPVVFLYVPPRQLFISTDGWFKAINPLCEYAGTKTVHRMKGRALRRSLFTHNFRLRLLLFSFSFVLQKFLFPGALQAIGLITTR